MACLWAGVEVMMLFRMSSKAFLGPPDAREGMGIFDMVVVWNQDVSSDTNLDSIADSKLCLRVLECKGD